ncbi:MAG: polysaccharide deacetylase family protein [Chloroflexi bacterium]|uniref:Polysaccharide deacetylase family protein n=1 Tax=Candidatus Chlorohelix allophototropha TaxID=3003348 RepID=A0A8T7LVA5_9CHLR|nr:polysaccharide deacetylase family protein [Chloroflexota bacterium]WJW66670.1 polysaccharide deacetylase family protein [Chloroflexota bacterium L227-S17]
MRKRLILLLLFCMLFSACSSDSVPNETLTPNPEVSSAPFWFLRTPTPLEETINTTLEPAITITPIPIATEPLTTAPVTTIDITEPTASPVPLNTTTVAKTVASPPKTTTIAAKTTIAATVAYATPIPGLSEIAKGRTGKKQVAITFDAGSSGEAFPLIKTALDKYGIKITFFLTGLWAEHYPQYVKQLADDKMELGNHSWNHPDMTKIGMEEIRTELLRTDALIQQQAGKSTRPLFRFPYGARTAREQGIVNGLGYRSIFWTLDSLDSVGAPKSADFLVQRINGQTDAQLDGAIILMHIGAQTSAEALPLIIQKLQARGFKIVTVSQLIN